LNNVQQRVHVTVAAACAHQALPHMTAAFGVFWGHNCTHNRGFGVLGRQLASRALLHGILFAITAANPSKILEIYTMSIYVIRAICHFAGGNHTRGWVCANGDLLQRIARTLLNWSAQTVFSPVNSQDETIHLKAARSLAHAACRDPSRAIVAVPTHTPLVSSPHVIDSAAAVPRVWTTVHKTDEPAPRARMNVTVDQLVLADKPEAHRNCAMYVTMLTRSDPSDLALTAYGVCRPITSTAC
jgi:hypothetical protein